MRFPVAALLIFMTAFSLLTFMVVQLWRAAPQATSSALIGAVIGASVMLLARFGIYLYQFSIGPISAFTVGTLIPVVIVFGLGHVARADAAFAGMAIGFLLQQYSLYISKKLLEICGVEQR